MFVLRGQVICKSTYTWAQLLSVHLSAETVRAVYMCYARGLIHFNVGVIQSKGKLSKIKNVIIQLE